MFLVERGHGSPLVFVPGLQGRWEYARPAIDALAQWFRVITFPLGDEPSAEVALSPASGLDFYADQVSAALDATGQARAIVCGLSFGGLVALRWAARSPDRVDALVLASTPGPGWELGRRHALYARLPWIFGPVFLAEAPGRAHAEVKAALPTLRARLAFGLSMARTVVVSPPSPARMAARAKLIAAYDAEADCARLSTPTLVITGEARLDRVVPVEGSARYARLIKGAERAVLERTGHQGALTRPEAFAGLVRDFSLRVDRERPANGRLAGQHDAA
jgi:pimeloyl-ACP methyl ester carboxylesterase